MELLTQALLELALAVLAVLTPVAVGYAVELLRRKVGKEGLEKIQQEFWQKQELARLAVLFAQQAYKEMDGPAKYDRAAAWLAEQCNGIGLTFTAAEIKGLIESALKDLKHEFGEAWREAKGQ